MPGIYAAIIEKIFFSRFQPGMKALAFEREDIVRVANELNIALPKNLGDLVYSFRYRALLPKSIQSEAGEGNVWIIRPIGKPDINSTLSPIDRWFQTKTWLPPKCLILRRE